MEDSYYPINFMRRSSELNWPIIKWMQRELDFRRRLSEVVCKSPSAATVETDVVVNEKEKRRLDLCRYLLKS
jgi:hypothetical protein